MYTGHVYGMIKEIKESEDWLNNGDLSVIVNIDAPDIIVCGKLIASVSVSFVHHADLK